MQRERLTRRQVERMIRMDEHGQALGFHFPKRSALEKLQSGDFHGTALFLHDRLATDPREFRRALESGIEGTIKFSMEEDNAALLGRRSREIRVHHAPLVLSLKHLKGGFPGTNKGGDQLARDTFGFMPREKLRRVEPPFRNPYKLIVMPVAQFRKILAEARKKDTSIAQSHHVQKKLTQWFADQLIRHWKQRIRS